jgi:hypothetical protein
MRKGQIEHVTDIPQNNGQPSHDGNRKTFEVMILI